MLPKKNTTEFERKIFGIWGTFSTPSGHVDYLEVKARLGIKGNDPEQRLTRDLSLVREALPIEGMDFNQLLQRDLDDHRVAEKLIPYLLDSQTQGPSFFPPIVAALMPFKGPTPSDAFPKRCEIAHYTDSDGTNWAGYSQGDAYKFERLKEEDGATHHIRIGKLSWNPENARLVVIDGQHRAMALLAIDRTYNNGWGSSSGAKYRCFYESTIKNYINSIGSDAVEQLLSSIELPVNIVWFPKLTPPSDNYPRAARKLFVDVNKNARPPSASRLMLLSDTNLAHILTRTLLNRFRTTESKFPIYAVEYDHPAQDQTSTSKWSVITNITSISACVYKLLWGPEKYITHVDRTFTGKHSERDADDFFRKSINIKSYIPDVYTEDGREIQRSSIGINLFTQSIIPDIERALTEGWGQIIIKMYEELTPYKAHIDALAELEEGWLTTSEPSELAYEATFKGVGIYWTLRDGVSSWHETNRIRKDREEPPLSKTDVVNAWQILDEKQAIFSGIRAKHLLKSEKDSTAANAAFAIYATNACQLGFVMMARSLAHFAQIPQEGLTNYFQAVINATNAGLAWDGRKGGRLLFISKGEGAKHPLNQIPKLDTPHCIYFRYFWLELLASKEATVALAHVIDPEIVSDARNKARALYLNYLRSEHRKMLKRATPDIKPAILDKKTEENATKALSKALKHWFGTSNQDFDTWLAAAKNTNDNLPDLSIADDNSDEDLEHPEEVSEIDRILSE